MKTPRHSPRPVPLPLIIPDAAVEDAMRQLREAAAAKKCWSCGCLHSTLRAIEQAISIESRPAALDEAIRAAHDRLADVKYDCLGCEVCYPALAVNALNVEAEPCPTEQVEERAGWPPLPGSYRVLKYRAPVAVCTLTDHGLPAAIAGAAEPEIAIVGTLQTENLGIERVIQNSVANPNIRFLILCGADSRRMIGHLPGQSLVALARAGIDGHSRIVGAAGKRPVLRNVSAAAVEHFRRTVEVVDLVGEVGIGAILAATRSCAARNPGPAEPFSSQRVIETVHGHVAERMVPDPAGYFVVYPDRSRQLLSLEHYTNDGVLDTMIEGGTAAEVYMPAIERGLLSRLDHAAYLGRELARAEQALQSGEMYVQDAAPEQPGTSKATTCACGPRCLEGDT